MIKEHGFDAFHYEGNEYTDRLEMILNDNSPDHIVFPIVQMAGTIPLDKLDKNCNSLSRSGYRGVAHSFP